MSVADVIIILLACSASYALGVATKTTGTPLDRWRGEDDDPDLMRWTLDDARLRIAELEEDLRGARALADQAEATLEGALEDLADAEDRIRELGGRP